MCPEHIAAIATLIVAGSAAKRALSALIEHSLADWSGSTASAQTKG